LECQEENTVQPQIVFALGTEWHYRLTPKFLYYGEYSTLAWLSAADANDTLLFSTWFTKYVRDYMCVTVLEELCWLCCVLSIAQENAVDLHNVSRVL
jgi:hypothetical protein